MSDRLAMDPSANTSMNSSHHQNPQQYSILDGIQSYTGSDGLQNGDADLSRFFDPELFDSTTIGNGFSQPSMSMSQDFDPNAARHSNTPELAQYNPPQQSFGHHQYSQSFYNPQQMNPANYDSRFYPHSSASPVAFDRGYAYPPQINYTSQSFSNQQLSVPQRQTPTPVPSYQQRQPQSSPYVNIAQRPAQMSHAQVRQ
jgi:hypothetical protein